MLLCAEYRSVFVQRSAVIPVGLGDENPLSLGRIGFSLALPWEERLMAKSNRREGGIVSRGVNTVCLFLHFHYWQRKHDRSGATGPSPLPHHRTCIDRVGCLQLQCQRFKGIQHFPLEYRCFERTWCVYIQNRFPKKLVSPSSVPTFRRNTLFPLEC